MKKFLIVFSVLWLTASFTFANSVNNQDENPIIKQVLQDLDSVFQKNPEKLDDYLAKMQLLSEQQDTILKEAVRNNDKDLIQKLVKDRKLFRQVNNHLYKLKENKQQKKSDFGGDVYTFKSQVLMPRLSMTRGEDDYYAFPSHKTYVQLNLSQSISGDIKNVISAEYDGKKISPKYYYAGDNSLRDLGWKKEGEKITTNNGKEQDTYFFFDMPQLASQDMKNITFKLGNNVINGKDLFIQPAISPIYTIKESSKGYVFCKAVAEWKGADSATKQYSEKECEDASNLKFSKDMHSDILDYAKFLYLK